MRINYDPALPIYFGFDFGYRNPFVCLWIQPQKKGERVMVLDEYYQTYRTTAENARALMNHHISMGYGEIACGYPDPSNPEGIAVLEQVLGVEMRAPRVSVVRGHEIIRRWLKVNPEDGLPGLIFHHRCQNLIREITGYLKHEPGKGAHHGADALRYFFTGWEA